MVWRRDLHIRTFPFCILLTSLVFLAAASESSEKRCDGEQIERQACSSQACNPCPCNQSVYTEWSSWSAPSSFDYVGHKSCTGLCGRSRKIKSSEDECTTTCLGSGALNLKETKRCDEPACASSSRDCTFTDWSGWQGCVSASDEGHSTRTRTIGTQASDGGTPCEGPLLQTKPCKADHAHCSFAAWSTWSACANDCGTSGVSTRDRTVGQPASRHGEACVGNTTEEKNCPVVACVSPVHCSLGAWQDWSACDANGGHKGVRTRKRPAFSPGSNGGTPCSGVQKETQPCGGKELQLPSDCIISPWSVWTVCDKDCGGGQQSRNRSVSQAATGGGSCALFTSKQVAACNVQKCSTDCQVGVWSEWEACSVTCGQGNRTRRRATFVDGQAGQPVNANANRILCPDVAITELSSCQATLCLSANEDCVVGAWSAWSQCSNTCAGVHRRARNITTPAKGDGKICGSLPMAQIEQCSKNSSAACSGHHDPVDCVLSNWTTTSNCTVSCGGGYLTKKRSVLLASAYGGKPCNAELTRYEPCHAFACPTSQCIDCKWNQWSDWDACSSCSGQRERRRDLNTPGNYCGIKCDPAHKVETAPCIATPGCQGIVQYCTWSEWGTASACPHTCGFHSVMRSRQLTKIVSSEPKSYLSKSFVQDSLTCSDHQTSFSSCGGRKCDSAEALACTPQDCYPSAWSDWSAPAQNLGLCYRSRVISQFNSCGGRACNGTLEETKSCGAWKPPVDCTMETWSTWSSCASNDDQSSRSRRIMRLVVNGGLPCQGGLHQTRPCDPNFQEPRNCEMQVWADWNACSSTCYGGIKKRRRDIKFAGVWPGKPCDTSAEETQECNHLIPCSSAPVNCTFTQWSDWDACDNKKQKYRTRKQIGGQIIKDSRVCGSHRVSETADCTQIVQDCVVSLWSDWGQCDKTCGLGTVERHRTIKQNATKNASISGKACPIALGEAKPCNNSGCNPTIDCDLTSWREWTACTTTCGVGQKTRSRFISNNRSKWGDGCNNTLMETRPCENRNSCVADSVCRWSDWNSWGACSKSCGGGMSSRNRHVISDPLPGEDMLDRKCPPKTEEEVKKCSLDPCSVEVCINGSWHDWSDWHVCSSTCSDGYTTRHRTTKVQASACGKIANGSSAEVKKCEDAAMCLFPIDCQFEEWQDWGSCSASCDGLHERVRLVKSYSVNGGAVCEGATKEYASCNPSTNTLGCTKPEVSQDCKLGVWSAFTTCSTTCGGGQKERSRVVITPSRGDGRACFGNFSEIAACNTQLCHPSMAPRDCLIGDWMDWAVCDQCGGNRTRRRIVKQYAQFGGTPCNSTSLIEVGKCDRSCWGDHMCIWGDWSAMTPCSASCGHGTRNRSRKLILVPTQVGVTTQALYEDDDLEARVQELYKESMKAKTQHAREVAMSFFVGCVCLLAVLKISASWQGNKKTATHRRITQEQQFSVDGFKALSTEEEMVQI